MRIQSLASYPIKGAAGTDHASAGIGLKGLAGDRRWMIVDEDGVFVSQREVAELARLGVTNEPDGVTLAIPGEGDRFVPRPDGQLRERVRIWSDEVDAAACERAASEGLSRWLGTEVRLVHFDDQASRSVAREWMDREAPVAFADGFPLLVTFSASLDVLNEAIREAGGEPVPMARFRPNIVIEGGGAFEEDGLSTIEVSGVVLDLVKPCARCVVTTIDQTSGERTGKEPLATLARIHRSGDDRAAGALFGWNAVPRGPGHLRVGDSVAVRTRRGAPWPIA